MRPPFAFPLLSAMRVAFCHPDLGIGGAERFIVDAASELQQRGHTVHVYTAHYDPARCACSTPQRYAARCSLPVAVGPERRCSGCTRVHAASCAVAA